MSDDRPLKSAYELAMERLRSQDRDRGEAERKPLTAEQKAAIAEARAQGKARLAEVEIMHRKRVAEAGGDPAALQELDERLRRDRDRIASSVESKVARIRRGVD
jgi:hypothetical protein